MFAYLKPLFSKTPLLAIDFGFDEIRLLQLEKKAQGLHIEKMLIHPLSDHNRNATEKEDWEQNLKALQILVKQEDLHSFSAAFALPAISVMKKQIEYPVFSEGDLEQALWQNFSRYFPDIDEKEVYLDFVTKPLGEDVLSVLLVAARKRPIEQLIKIAHQSNLIANVVDVDLYALARAASFYFYSDPEGKSQVAAVFNLGWPIFSLVVFTATDLVFHYQWHCDQVVFQRPFHFLDQVVLQLQNAWQLCLATHPKLKIDFLGISGEWAHLEEVVTLLQRYLLREIKMINPFQVMSYSDVLQKEAILRLSPRFLLCCGLALHGTVG